MTLSYTLCACVAVVCCSCTHMYRDRVSRVRWRFLSARYQEFYWSTSLWSKSVCMDQYGNSTQWKCVVLFSIYSSSHPPRMCTALTIAQCVRGELGQKRFFFHAHGILLGDGLYSYIYILARMYSCIKLFSCFWVGRYANELTHKNDQQTVVT